MIPIILLGASTRAAAMSARRAGWSPWCADLFADADLEHIATVRKVSPHQYPDGLIDALADAPMAPVMYTGSLENRPDLIAKINRPLWGNSASTLRAIRSPGRWTQYLRDFGIPCPSACDRAQTNGAWLLKPRRSAGGIGIHSYVFKPFNPRTHFLQERIEGISCSANFIGAGASAVFLGVTQQLIGIPWLNAIGFQYCGNIGPLPLTADEEKRWRHIGTALSAFRLRGLFGVDAIVRDGVPWPVEINPRYTASVEVLERWCAQPVLPLHQAAFESAPLPDFHIPAKPIVHGKAIMYARATFEFPDCPWCDQSEYADIPHGGEIIERGRPVLTLFAFAATTSECLAKLREKAHALDRRLWG